MIKEKVNKNAILSLLVLVLFYLGSGCSKPAGSSHSESKPAGSSNDKKWVCVDYDNNNKCDVYYDRYSIHKVYPGIFDVWEKWYGEDVKNDELEAAVREGLPASSFNNFAYELSLDRINCNDQTFDTISSIDYDIHGNVIYSINYGNHIHPQYSPIPPGTIIYAIYKAVCKGR